MPSRILKASLAAASLLLVTPLSGMAQTQGSEAHHAQSQSGPAVLSTPDAGAMQGMPRPGASGGGSMPMMNGSGPEMEMMDCPMMAQMMRMHPGMMTQMMRMHPEMMATMHGQRGGSGDMMGQGPGSGTMMGQGSRSGMMMRPGGMALDSGVVTPIQHLSVDDARHYFEHRLRQIGNARLKLGEVAETNDDLITVDIVTVDDSLVDRLEVDRHSGAIQRAQ